MTLFDKIKDFFTIVKILNNFEPLKTIVDLQAKVREFEEQLKLKDDKINELEAALQIKGKMIFEDSAYFSVDEANNKKDGPFCAKCYDIDRKICRLIAKKEEPMVLCPSCKTEFASRPIFNYLRPEVEINRLKIFKSFKM